jgi:hypothetical protein
VTTANCSERRSRRARPVSAAPPERRKHEPGNREQQATGSARGGRES